tara:strand:+ start:193 stop:477 length:285 start_codon:yes stop_codon:yes gene_type:complete
MPLPEIHYDEWFHDKKEYENPLDSMPIATDKTPVERLHDDIREESMHEKMYQIATSKYNPFAVGGSESIHDFDGGSEQIWAEDLPDLAPSEYEP